MKNSLKSLESLKSTSTRISSEKKQINRALNTSKFIIESMNSTQDDVFYTTDKIESFSFDDIKAELFNSTTEKTPNSTREASQLSLTMQGIYTDLLSAASNFTFGKEIQLPSEVLESQYGQYTKGIRETISNLKNNNIAVETIATARILLGNILINKSSLYSIGYEPLSSPEWLKETSVYKYVKPYEDFLDTSVMGVNKIYANESMKIFSPKAKRLANLGIAQINGGMIPIVTATAKLSYSGYNNYINSISTGSIDNELMHLERYINAQRSLNDILNKNPKLKEALSLQEQDIASDDTQNKITEIFNKNPALKTIFKLKNVPLKYKNKKQEIIFLKSLKDLIKTNDDLKSPNKIWEPNEHELSDTKLKIAKIHFSEIYKAKLKKYQKHNEKLQNSVLNSSITSSLQEESIGILQSAYNAAKSETFNDKIALYDTLIDVFSTTGIEKLAIEAKKKNSLSKIATLRMDAPEYQREEPGTYNHEVANLAYQKQIQAMALEEITTMESIPEDPIKIKSLYEAAKLKAEDELKLDPLFTESILHPTTTSRIYDFGVGIFNNISPWTAKDTYDFSLNLYQRASNWIKASEKETSPEDSNSTERDKETSPEGSNSTERDDDNKFKILVPQEMKLNLKDIHIERAHTPDTVTHPITPPISPKDKKMHLPKEVLDGFKSISNDPNSENHHSTPTKGIVINRRDKRTPD